MNFGQLFGNNRNLFGNCRTVSEIFRKRWSRSNLQIISGNLIKKSSRKALSNLGTNLISASSMAGVFLRFLYALHFIIILILFISIFRVAWRCAYCAEYFYLHDCLLMSFSFLGSSHGQRQLDNVPKLFFSSATLGTYEVYLVSLLDYR